MPAKFNDRRIILDQGRVILPTLQERQEGLGESDIAQVVGDELFLDVVQIDRVGFAEIHSSLNARIEDDAIQIGMAFGDAGEGRSAKTLGPCTDPYALRCKFGDLIQGSNVKGSGDRLLFAMLMNEVNQPLLPAARNNDLRPSLNALGRKSFSDTTSCPNHEYFFIRPRHDIFFFRKEDGLVYLHQLMRLVGEQSNIDYWGS